MRLGGVLALAFFLAGCIEQAIVISVAPDGSGTVTVTQIPRPTAWMQEQMKKQGQAPAPLNAASVAKWATVFTDGMTAVSATAVTDGQGERLEAVYSFTDVTKVHIPTGVLAENMGAGTVITFRFTPGSGAAGTAVLVAIMPKPKPKDPSVKEVTSDPKQDEATLKQIRELADTCRTSVVVAPTRPVAKSSSRFVAGNRVTLMQLDYGQIFNNKRLLDARTKSVALDQVDALNKLPGCKVSTGEVAISF